MSNYCYVLVCMHTGAYHVYIVRMRHLQFLAE